MNAAIRPPDRSSAPKVKVPSPSVAAVRDATTTPTRPFGEVLGAAKANTIRFETSEHRSSAASSTAKGQKVGRLRAESRSAKDGEVRSPVAPIVAPFIPAESDVPNAPKVSTSSGVPEVESLVTKVFGAAMDRRVDSRTGSSARPGPTTPTPDEKSSRSVAIESEVTRQTTSSETVSSERVMTTARAVNQVGQPTSISRADAGIESAQPVAPLGERIPLSPVPTARLARYVADSRSVTQSPTAVAFPHPTTPRVVVRSVESARRVPALPHSSGRDAIRTDSTAPPLTWPSVAPDQSRVVSVIAPSAESYAQARVVPAASLDVHRFVDDVSRMASADGNYRVSLSLHPEILGSVRATVSLVGNDLHVNLSPESRQAHEILGHELETLRAELGRGGLNVHVTLHDHGSHRGQQERRDPRASEFIDDANGESVANQTEPGEGQIHVIL